MCLISCVRFCVGLLSLSITIRRLTVAFGAVTVVAQFLDDLREAKVDNLQSTHVSHRLIFVYCEKLSERSYTCTWDTIHTYEIMRTKVNETRNAFCGTWYLPHSHVHVHNERTVPIIMAGCIAQARNGRISTSGEKI